MVTPPVQRFGTHHTKAFLLVYDTGCRVCVHTANLIHGDVHKRTNAMWCQDFPLKSGEFLLIFVRAIRMTSCFVYSI